MPNIYTDLFVDTTTKALINEWPGLRSVIAKSGSSLKEKQEKEVDSFENLQPLMSDQQFRDATLGPLHPFINKLLWAYGQIAKLRLKLIITQDDTLNPHIRDKEVPLLSPVDLKQINIASLDKALHQLDEFTREKYPNWLEFIENSSHTLIMQLTLNDLALSESEISSFNEQETISELHAQFTDLHLTLPKVKQENYAVADYLKLKTILIVHSTLSRQHKPNSTKDIDSLLKPLKSEFKQIEKEEEKLTQQLHKEVDQLLPQLNP